MVVEYMIFLLLCLIRGFVFVIDCSQFQERVSE